MTTTSIKPTTPRIIRDNGNRSNLRNAMIGNKATDE